MPDTSRIFQSSFNFSDPAPANLQVVKEPAGLRWIQKAPDAPYFITDNGKVWTPIGQNDAVTWPDFAGIFRRKDLALVESYFTMLRNTGVTVTRLMLEYCQGQHRYIERPTGNFQPNMVQLWDDVFTLAEKHGIRILLTPFDTYWMWRRWQYHPYHTNNGGSCSKRSQWLLCPQTRDAIKGRLAFATERWGGSGALFAWDLWNEIMPAHAGNAAENIAGFVQDAGSFLRQKELALYGRSHLQTVSVFTPVLENDHIIAETIFRHAALDFATVHFYEKDTIDHPRNTIDAALSTGRLTRDMLAQITDGRPFFDSEHGPIHTFKDKRKTLPEPFDDEYFRHMQWAHLASGGAGGGMRWPNRHPHTLTNGMRKAQLALARFVEEINWANFKRRNLNHEVSSSDKHIAVFACGDERQAIVWLLRTNATGKDRMVSKEVLALPFVLNVPLIKGNLRITMFNTLEGAVTNTYTLVNGHDILSLQMPAVNTDLAMAITAC